MSSAIPDRPNPGRGRLPTGTAGRIAELLRQREQTVDELATALALTGNAVRLHLARLERDGIVERAGSRTGVSRPSTLYRVSSEGELRFSHAYVPVLTQLLHVLSRRLRPATFDAVLRQVGQELMAGRPRPVGTLRQRAEQGSALLNELGGLSHVAMEGRRLVIRGDACPLAAATRDHPEACSALESLLSSFVNAPVTSCCDREQVHCCFSVGPERLSQ